MADTEIERAFATLAGAFTLTETELNEEIGAIEAQIGELKERIIQLHGKQQSLAHDRGSLAEMYNRYCETDNNGHPIEF